MGDSKLFKKAPIKKNPALGRDASHYHQGRRWAGQKSVISLRFCNLSR